MRIYIAGKISGDKEYRKKFDAIYDHLIHKYGCPVYNPAKQPEGLSYKEYLYNGIDLLKNCNVIYMIKGWEDSKGARAEHAIAVALGYKIIYES